MTSRCAVFKLKIPGEVSYKIFLPGLAENVCLNTALPNMPVVMLNVAELEELKRYFGKSPYVYFFHADFSENGHLIPHFRKTCIR